MYSYTSHKKSEDHCPSTNIDKLGGNSHLPAPRSQILSGEAP